MIWHLIQKKGQREIQCQGLEDICQLKALIGLIQQHRGLTAALLNGDEQVKPKLEALRRIINDKQTHLANTQVQYSERWAAYTDHWQRLLQFNQHSCPDNSFEQHTTMIKNLAYLLEDTAELSYLSADYLPALNNIGYVWRELILTTENVGQSRAIGTGVATQKTCSSVDKIRLNYLIQTLNQTSEVTIQQLSSLPQEQQTHAKLVNNASTKLKQLTQVMTNELVEAQPVTINNQHYFELATKTMSELNEIFNHQVRQLKQNL